MENLEECNVRHVMTNGKFIVIDGKINFERKPYQAPDWALNTIYLRRKLIPEDFKIRTKKRQNFCFVGKDNTMKPIHPGRILKREIDARGLSANKLALALRVPSGRITQIINHGCLSDQINKLKINEIDAK